MRTWPAIDVDRLTEPDLLHAALTDFDVVAIDERAPDSWTVVFQTAGDRDRAAHAIPAVFPDLRVERVDVPDEDWALRSQAGLNAIRVGSIIVAPPWDVPAGAIEATTAPGASAAVRDPVVIVIQPSMGFGTGHHATTRLCLQALQQLNIEGRTAIDVGTGSGVLAIAALLRGAAHAVAIDDDPDAVQAARENADRNGVSVEFLVADMRATALSPFDLVMANLTGGLIVQSASRRQDLMPARGCIILSGFQDHEEAAVLAALPALRVADRGQEDEWVCVTLRHERAFE